MGERNGLQEDRRKAEQTGGSATEQVVTPEPGVYRDVAFEDYLAWDAVSNSRLKLARRSLEHYQAGLNLNSESDALLFGSLVHAGRLEPATVAERYAVMPDFVNDERNVDKRGKQSRGFTTWVRDQQDEWRKEHKGLQAVTQEHYDNMIGVLSALYRNKRAMDVLGGDGDTEVSILWVDPETGLRCKARFDKLKESQGRFADLKTTQDASRFEKYIIDFGYHRQCAFYQKGWHVLTRQRLEPWLVAVEKVKPWGTRAAPMAGDLLADGWDEVQEDLESVAVAQQTQRWSGYENPEVWDGPEWYKRKRDAEPMEVTIGGRTIAV